MYTTRSKIKAALAVVCGALGYFVGGALAWVYYVAPVTSSEALGEFFHGLAGGC
jgi:hypothetical protein